MEKNFNDIFEIDISKSKIKNSKDEDKKINFIPKIRQSTRLKKQYEKYLSSKLEKGKNFQKLIDKSEPALTYNIHKNNKYYFVKMYIVKFRGKTYKHKVLTEIS